MRKVLINILLAALIAGTAVFLASIYLNEQKESDAQIAAREQMIREYQDEIYALQKAVTEKGKEAFCEAEQASVLYGFMPTCAEELEQIAQWTEGYPEKPLLILDVSRETEALNQIIQAADWDRYTPAVSMEADDADTIAAAKAIVQTLQENGCTGPNILLFRSLSITEDNLKRITEAGFSILLRYDDNYRSGLAGDGTPLLAYARIHSETDFREVANAMIRVKSTAAIIYDFERLNDATLLRESIESCMAYYREQVDSGKMRFASAEEAAQEIVRITQEDQRLRREYEEFAAKADARIKDLQKIVLGIQTENAE